MDKMVVMRVLTLIVLVSPFTAHGEVDFTLSPRVWFFYDELSAGNLNSQENAQGVIEPISTVAEPFDIPLAGLSLAFRSTEFLPSTTFTLTGLFGSDKEIVTSRGSSVLNCSASVGGCVSRELLPDDQATDQRLRTSFNTTVQDLERLDLELVAQTQLNDLASWVIGLRYERARIDTQTQLIFEQSVISSQADQNPNITGPEIEIVEQALVEGDQGYDLATLRAGLTGVSPINSNSTHLFYGSLYGFVGYRWEHKDPNRLFDDTTLIGPDISVGYIWRISPSFSLDFRYRALAFFFVSSDEGDGDDPKITHGPNLGLNIQF